MFPFTTPVTRLRGCLCLAGLLFLIACAPRPRSLEPADVLRCQPFPQQPTSALCAIQPGNAYSHWFLIEDGFVQQLPIDMVEASLSGFSLSPSGDLVAIISTGEGHPLLQIYSLGKLLSDGQVEHLQGWDPYPGYIDIVGWEGDDLIVVSDMPLHTEFDRYADYSDSPEYRFRWTVDRPDLELIEKVESEAKPDFPTIYFAFDSLTLSREEKAKLDAVATDLQLKYSPDLSVEGHTDERGTDEYNLALGERMAKVVRDYLLSRGVPASQLSVVSHGESRPLDPGHEEEAWARNRRVELVWEP